MLRLAGVRARVSRSTVLLALAWAAFLLVAALRFPFHGIWHDDAVYVALGRSVSEGRYCLEQLPGDPPQTRYPPLHPGVLAGCWWLGACPGATPWAFALPGVLAAACGLGLWSCLLRRQLRLSPAQTMVVMALVAASPALIQLCTCAMAEPWLFLLIPAALLVLGEPGSGATPMSRALLAGALLGTAVLAKTIALVPLLGIAAQLLAQRRGRTALVLLGTGLLVAAPWWLWAMSQRDSSTPLLLQYYLGYERLLCQGLGSWWEVLPDRLRDLASGTSRQAMAALFAPEVWSALPGWTRSTLIFGTALLALAALAAGLRHLRRGPPVWGAVCALWLLALLLADSSWRHALLALPAAFALGCRASGRRWPLVAACCALLTLPATVAQLQLRPERGARMWREQIATHGYPALVAAVHRHVPMDGVLASDLDAWLFLHTRRRAVMPAPTPEHVGYHVDPEALGRLCRDEWRRVGVSHVVVEPLLAEPERSIVLESWRRGDLVELAVDLPPGFHLLHFRR